MKKRVQSYITIYALGQTLKMKVTVCLKSRLTRDFRHYIPENLEQFLQLVFGELFKLSYGVKQFVGLALGKRID
jgi:hypothetical protein